MPKGNDILATIDLPDAAPPMLSDPKLTKQLDDL